MNRPAILATILLLLLASALGLWIEWNRPARRIARLTKKAIACAEKAPGESPLAAALKANALQDLLAETITCSAPDDGLPPFTLSRSEFVQQAYAFRNRFDSVDIQVHSAQLVEGSPYAHSADFCHALLVTVLAPTSLEEPLDDSFQLFIGFVRRDRALLISSFSLIRPPA